MVCLIYGPLLVEYFPTKGWQAEGGEEDNKAMGRKKIWKEGEQGKQKEGGKRKQTWKYNSKKSWKAGEESSIYKCIQSIPAWGHAAAWPLRDSQLRGGVQSIGRRGQSRGVHGGAWVFKTRIPRKKQIAHSFSSSSPDAPALTHSAKEMISDCCLSEGRGRPNLVHIQLWRHCGKYISIQSFSPVSYQYFRASQWCPTEVTLSARYRKAQDKYVTFFIFYLFYFISDAISFSRAIEVTVMFLWAQSYLIS